MTDDFYTSNGFLTRQEGSKISSSQEDYLEMIYRIYLDNGEIRCADLASRLHVQPSSVTKAVSKLVSQGLVSCEKYGAIYLTERGRCQGAYLLKRHNVLKEFFVCLHGDTAGAFREAELAEHFMSPETIYKIERLNRILLRFEGESVRQGGERDDEFSKKFKKALDK